MDKTIYGQSKVMGFDPKVINLVYIDNALFRQWVTVSKCSENSYSQILRIFKFDGFP